MSFSKSVTGTHAEAVTAVRDDSTLPHSVKAFVTEFLGTDEKHAHGAAESVEVSISGHVGEESSVSVQIHCIPKPKPVKKAKPAKGKDADEAPPVE